MRILAVAIFAALCLLAKASLPTKPTISATLKDNKVKSSDGFNLNVAVPFKFEDAVFGFKYALENLSLTPESIFFRKTAETSQEGKLTLDGDYDVSPNKVGLAIRWVSKKLQLDAGARVDSKEYLTEVDVSKTIDVEDKKVTLSGAYDLKKKNGALGLDVKVDATNFALAYDGEDEDVSFSVSHEIDKENILTPSVSSKAHVGLAYLRKWDGGQLKAKYSYPEDKLNLEWKDDGSNGAWVTNAEVPIRNAKQTKVSLTRDWTY